MSDDTPTVRFDQPQDGPGGPGYGGPGDPGGPTPGGPTPGEPDDGQKKSRRLVIILSIVGGVLLIAVIILLAVLFARGSGSTPTPTPTTTSESPSPTPSQTPSQTPSPTPTKTVAPPPPSTAPAVGSFVVNTTTVQCPTANSTAPLSFSWTSTNASTAFFGVDTEDASIAPYFSNLPPNGSTANFPGDNNPFLFTCSAQKHTYTITVVGNGQKASKSVTVTATQ
jgi:flagellar basal body-associated protein FliL